MSKTGISISTKLLSMNYYQLRVHFQNYVLVFFILIHKLDCLGPQHFGVILFKLGQNNDLFYISNKKLRKYIIIEIFLITKLLIKAKLQEK